MYPPTHFHSKLGFLELIFLCKAPKCIIVTGVIGIRTCLTRHVDDFVYDTRQRVEVFQGVDEFRPTGNAFNFRNVNVSNSCEG